MERQRNNEQRREKEGGTAQGEGGREGKRGWRKEGGTGGGWRKEGGRRKEEGRPDGKRTGEGMK